MTCEDKRSSFLRISCKALVRRMHLSFCFYHSGMGIGAGLSPAIRRDTSTRTCRGNWAESMRIPPHHACTKGIFPSPKKPPPFQTTPPASTLPQNKITQLLLHCSSQTQTRGRRKTGPPKACRRSQHLFRLTFMNMFMSVKQSTSLVRNDGIIASVCMSILYCSHLVATMVFVPVWRSATLIEAFY